MASPKSPQEMFQVMKGNIREKTGKGFDAWVALAKASGLEKFKVLTDYMKSEHSLTHGYAQLVAWGVLDPGRLEASNQEPQFVDDLYSGKKEHLRPIHDRLFREGLAMEKDVEQVICKTYSSLRAKSQYAMVVPKTNTAVDLELAFSEPPSGIERLEPIKSSNPKITHRIRIKSEQEVDEEVLGALRTALEQNRG